MPTNDSIFRNFSILTSDPFKSTRVAWRQQNLNSEIISLQIFSTLPQYHVDSKDTILNHEETLCQDQMIQDHPGFGK